MTEITFLGTGTSQGVPVIGCRCAVCTSGDRRDNRLRTSALIRTGDTTLVIDAGPDFRQQMLTHKVTDIDGILLTHEHKDHTGGIDDVRAYNYIKGKPVDIYGTERVLDAVRKDYEYAFREHKYPGVPDIRLHAISAGIPFSIGHTHVTPVQGYHHRLPVLGFRIDDVAYLTDFNRICEGELAKLQGLDILVVNALRHELHLSHFNLDQALELRAKLRPHRTYLTHVSHQMGLYEIIGQDLPADTWFAYDNLVVRSGH